MASVLKAGAVYERASGEMFVSDFHILAGDAAITAEQLREAARANGTYHKEGDA